MAQTAVLGCGEVDATEKTVTVYSQGVNQWSFGTDKVNAIINCHLATGRIGKPGMGPFSFTGQPNAMGGREVGGLANQLAAHMDFDPWDVDRVRRFWDAPNIAERPGLKALDLFEAIDSGGVKAVWIMATNPTVSLPDADRFRDALRRCELVVVSDCVAATDTTACANVLLPAAAWGEKDGTVTNSERCISRQRAFLEPPGEARPDWWIVTEVARRLGFAAAFPYASAADIFREHASLSAFENNGARDFDLSALASVDDHAYDSLSPVQWPVRFEDRKGTARMCTEGRFHTADGRARFLPIGDRAPARATDDTYPLVLNTGRIRDQWHTMTRTARTPRLTAHRPEPFVEIHPEDAERLALVEGMLARVASRHGRFVGRVRVSDDQRRGSVFIPMHWSSQFAVEGRADALVNPALDPVSGQPEFKHTPVQVRPLEHRWTGFVLSKDELEIGGACYCVRVPGRGSQRYELAGESAPADWSGWARKLFDTDGDWLDYEDRARGSYRAALVRDGRLFGCVFITESGSLPSRDWLGGLFSDDSLKSADRACVLAGRPASGCPDRGRTVCACFDVGFNTIVEAIDKQHLTSVEAIGEALRAGTNCGSCVPELREILNLQGQRVA